MVGKASTIGIEISPTPSLIYTRGGQKSAKFGTAFNITQLFEAPAFENAARYLNSERNFLCSNDRPMSLPSLVMMVTCTSENRLSVVLHR